MNVEQLIAPEQYNITSELEAYKHDAERIAVRWFDADNHRIELSYQELFLK